jgi:hypothetical protein
LQVTLQLAISIATVTANQERFTNQIAADLAQSFNVSLSRIIIERIVAGSVIVEFLVLAVPASSSPVAPSGPSSIAELSIVFAQQISNPNSTFWAGMWTSTSNSSAPPIVTSVTTVFCSGTAQYELSCPTVSANTATGGNSPLQPFPASATGFSVNLTEIKEEIKKELDSVLNTVFLLVVYIVGGLAGLGATFGIAYCICRRYRCLDLPMESPTSLAVGMPRTSIVDVYVLRPELFFIVSFFSKLRSHCDLPSNLLISITVCEKKCNRPAVAIPRWKRQPTNPRLK